MRPVFYYLAVGAILVLMSLGSGCSSLDFSRVSAYLAPMVTKVTDQQTASSSLPVYDQDERSLAVRRARAEHYVGEAVRDYYKGSLSSALENLERAKLFNPHNYGAFRLCGQIHFELDDYYKAFNNWSRATQLPNDDRSMSRDLTVLKQVIHYSRHEIEQLKSTVYRNPTDRVAAARLEELERKMKP